MIAATAGDTVRLAQLRSDSRHFYLVRISLIDAGRFIYAYLKEENEAPFEQVIDLHSSGSGFGSDNAIGFAQRGRQASERLGSEAP